MDNEVKCVDQKVLSSAQISSFYHDEFVESQIGDFLQLVRTDFLPTDLVVDVGGGCGYFAHALNLSCGVNVRVIDIDPVSVADCRTKGIDARVDNALSPEWVGDESTVCFNLVLHHLVADDEDGTRALQSSALICWRDRVQTLFINEYIYDSFFGALSGRLIFEITKSKRLSALAGLVARFVPSLRANTFGTGVRFRAHEEWLSLFRSLGFKVVAHSRGPEEIVSFARRMLLIRSCRRDSYVLKPD